MEALRTQEPPEMPDVPKMLRRETPDARPIRRQPARV
jgi:hypothetical protein